MGRISYTISKLRGRQNYDSWKKDMSLLQILEITPQHLILTFKPVRSHTILVCSLHWPGKTRTLGHALSSDSIVPKVLVVLVSPVSQTCSGCRKSLRNNTRSRNLRPWIYPCNLFVGTCKPIFQGPFHVWGEHQVCNFEVCGGG